MNPTKFDKDEKKTTVNQQRAAHAWKIVADIKQISGKDAESVKKEFATQAKKLSIRILASGLGASVAFLEAKKQAPALVKALGEWVSSRNWASRATNTSTANQLTQLIIENDSEFLRMATEECIAYLQWIVRFSETMELAPKSESQA